MKISQMSLGIDFCSSQWFKYLFPENINSICLYVQGNEGKKIFFVFKRHVI